MTKSMPAVLMALLIAVVAIPAHAQPSARRDYSAGRTGGGGTGELPFSNSTYRRPTVSPYTNLQQMGTNPLLAQNVYQQMVQPQVQQQQYDSFHPPPQQPVLTITHTHTHIL